MTIMENHHFAMDLADKADMAKRNGSIDIARNYLQEAFKYEHLAAMKFHKHENIEPTRSILFRSAASLALECEDYREAERMIAFGLSGYPPNEIAEELRDLLEKVNFERHLKLRGITLDPNEFQLSIWGPQIGFGVVQSREFGKRIEKIERLAQRTLERKLNLPFSETGRQKNNIYSKLDTYISVPRAASFAVTIQLGTFQQFLPGFDIGKDVVSEMVECLDLLNNRQDKELKERISDKDYHDNFVSISKHIAPDGNRVAYVGLTMQKDNKEKIVKLDRIRSDWDVVEHDNIANNVENNVKIKGYLRYADSTKTQNGRIILVDEKGGKHNINVPLSMMVDIVRPMFGNEVIVEGKPNQNGDIILEDINSINDYL